MSLLAVIKLDLVLLYNTLLPIITLNAYKPRILQRISYVVTLKVAKFQKLIHPRTIPRILIAH